MNLDTENLILELSRNVSPVKRVPSLLSMVGITAASALPFALVWLAIHGIRGDLVAGDLPEIFPAVGTSLMAIGLGALVAALAVTIPGRERAERLGWTGVAGGVLLICAVLIFAISPAGFENATAPMSRSIHCAFTALLLAIPAVVAATAYQWRTRSNVPLRGICAACVGSVGVGAVAVYLTCAVPEPFHMLIGHALTPAYMGGLLAVAMFAFWESGIPARSDP